MNIEDSSFPAGNEARRQDAHEAREHDDGGFIGFDPARELLIESFARGEGLVVDRKGIEPLGAGSRKTLGVRAVREDRGDSEALSLPVFSARRAQDGFKVASAAGKQNDDVLHGRVPRTGEKRNGG